MSSKIITIFGSSQPKEGEFEYCYAYELGRELAKNGFIICNGGYSGTMEASSKGALDAGGKAIGITVKDLNYVPHNEYLFEDIVMPDIFSRIKKMMDLASAFIILKGGTGTLVELSIVWEFINKGFCDQKPIIVASSFWKPLVDLFIDEKSLGEFYNKNGKVRPCTEYLTTIESVSEITKYLRKKL